MDTFLKWASNAWEAKPNLSAFFLFLSNVFSSHSEKKKNKCACVTTEILIMLILTTNTMTMIMGKKKEKTRGERGYIIQSTSSSSFLSVAFFFSACVQEQTWHNRDKYIIITALSSFLCVSHASTEHTRLTSAILDGEWELNQDTFFFSSFFSCRPVKTIKKIWLAPCYGVLQKITVHCEGTESHACLHNIWCSCVSRWEIQLFIYFPPYAFFSSVFFCYKNKKMHMLPCSKNNANIITLKLFRLLLSFFWYS